MTHLRIEHVTKRYGTVDALDDLHLDAGEDELVVIVGPSGCGKTTALRVVAGLASIDEGTVHIGRRNVTAVDAGDRNVSMVFQNHALFPHLTVAENIGFGLRARGASTGEVSAAVGAAARQVGCEELLSRRPDQISGGERQRVALARGLVRRPDVLLLDEPLSNLDAQLRLQMRRELRRLHDQVGGTMLYVTHDQVEALTLGDRIAVLRQGAVQQVGEPDDIYRRPVNRFVATFIGSPAMSLLPAIWDGTELRAGGVGFPPPSGIGPRQLSGRSLEIGVRPEHVELVDGDGAADSEAIEGGDARQGVVVRAVVELVESAGNETFVQLGIDGGAEITARSDPDRRLRVGESVGMSIAADRIHVFDGADGSAIR